MPISLNVAFAGTAPTDPEFEHPEGASIARLVREAVEPEGWVAGELDNWRDVGWSFVCQKGAAKLEFVISTMGQNDWMAQVAPQATPGLLGRALGKQPSASPVDVFNLARIIHRVLSRHPEYQGFRWRWDGPPGPDSDPEPVQWD